MLQRINPAYLSVRRQIMLWIISYVKLWRMVLLMGMGHATIVRLLPAIDVILVITPFSQQCSERIVPDFNHTSSIPTFFF